MSSQSATPILGRVLAAHRPPKLFVVSASFAGVLLLGIASLLTAEAIKSNPNMRALPVDYLPGVAAVASWIYYVQRSKTSTEVRWNCIHLVVVTITLTLTAYAIKPNEITIILLYWTMAVLSTAGAPLLIVIAIIVVHLSICAKVAAELEGKALADLSTEHDATRDA